MKTVRNVVGIMFSAWTSLALAAVPPLSDEQRQDYATHIFQGTVTNVHEHEVAMSDEVSRIERQADIEVAAVSKGSGLVVGGSVNVHYWTAGKRPAGWAGPQGQNGVMQPGDKVTVYTYHQAESDQYLLLSPNGFDHVAP